MKYSGATLVAGALSMASLATAQVEESLYSKRNLGKRFFDEQGNYNMCEYTTNSVENPPQFPLTDSSPLLQLSTTSTMSTHTWPNSVQAVQIAQTLPWDVLEVMPESRRSLTSPDQPTMTVCS